MKIKIKKLHPDAVIPTYAKHGDAGMDLVAVSSELNKEFLYKEYKTGLSIEIPEGYVGLIFPRSSLSDKSFALANSVGVIDSGYRGEITVRFKTDGNVSGKFIVNIPNAAPFLKNEFSDYKINHYKNGDKVAQLVILPYPHIEFEETDDLSKTERGATGYGSSDKWCRIDESFTRQTSPERGQFIKAIENIHPSAGVDVGMSEYIGGMADTGRWYLEKLNALSDRDLVSLYNYVKTK